MFAGVALNLADLLGAAAGRRVERAADLRLLHRLRAWSMPSVTLLMLDLFPTMRGMASSLQGFVHFSLSAVVAGTIAPFLVQSLPALALGMRSPPWQASRCGSSTSAVRARNSATGNHETHLSR